MDLFYDGVMVSGHPPAVVWLICPSAKGNALVHRLHQRAIYEDSSMLTRGVRTAIQFGVNYPPPEGGWPFDITGKVYFEDWRGVELYAPMIVPDVMEFKRRLRPFTARWLGESSACTRRTWNLTAQLCGPRSQPAI